MLRKGLALPRGAGFLLKNNNLSKGSAKSSPIDFQEASRSIAKLSDGEGGQ